MPAKDIYHNAVKNALLKDGWTITDDPLHIKWGQKDMYVDLGAQRLLAAEQGNKKIAVEMEDLKSAIGGFVTYRAVIRRLEPERTLYLAVRDNIFTALFEEPIGKLLIESENLYLVVFNPDSETIVQWIP
jgi:hypothetical protein